MLDRPTEALDASRHALLPLLSRFRRVVLAVSGGPDSMAMLVGLAHLAAREPSLPAISVCTVDHGLRPDAAGEARMVAAECQALGLEHRTLTLTPPHGPFNAQSWARTARYQALADALASLPDVTTDAGQQAILTAHTADDQAETLLMRASRGAGSDGLAGIRPETQIAGATVIRPFLTWSRSHLQAVLPASGITTVLDPSNQDRRYTRVRVRAWLKDAPAPDSERSVVDGLAHTAAIAAQESEALDHVAGQVLTTSRTWLDGARGREDIVRGYVMLTLDLAALPPVLSARVLRLALASLARRDVDQSRFDMARLLGLVDRFLAYPEGRFVLGGCAIAWRRPASCTTSGQRELILYAEAGRAGFPVLNLPPGQAGLWDQRCRVTNRSSVAVRVRAARADDGLHRTRLPRAVQYSLPIAVADEPLSGERIIGGDVPGLAWGSDQQSIAFTWPSRLDLT